MIQYCLTSTTSLRYIFPRWHYANGTTFWYRKWQLPSARPNCAEFFLLFYLTQSQYISQPKASSYYFRECKLLYIFAFQKQHRLDSFSLQNVRLTNLGICRLERQRLSFDCILYFDMFCEQVKVNTQSIFARALSIISVTTTYCNLT